jgi:hypothetical protein
MWDHSSEVHLSVPGRNALVYLITAMPLVLTREIIRIRVSFRDDPVISVLRIDDGPRFE